MSYREYVIAAWAVFAIALLWDYLVPRLQVRAALRAARLRKARTPARSPAPAPAPTELER